jgi:hypothetical protein
MRFAHPRAVPIVELANAPMKTAHGTKMRPFLKVVGWRNQEPATNGSPPAGNAMNDAIPF